MKNDRLKDTLRVFVVPTEILDTELDIYEKMIYMVLRSYANGQDDTAFPSYDTIAKKGSMSRRKAIDVVKKLEELGYLSKEKRKKVSNNNKVSDTSNLYTIHRPSDVQKSSEVVRTVHQGSARHALGAVHTVHQGSAQCAPENNNLKKLSLKKEEEEEASLIQSSLIKFLREKGVDEKSANLFVKTLKEKGLTGYTNEVCLKAIDMSLVDFVNGICNEPYVWAVGKLERILDGRINVAKESTTKTKQTSKRKPGRKQGVLPEWANEITYEEEPKQEITAEELEERRRKLRERFSQKQDD